MNSEYVMALIHGHTGVAPFRQFWVSYPIVFIIKNMSEHKLELALQLTRFCKSKQI